MSGLNNKDVEILGFYAENGNRELYWNYLAQKPGNDGYGLLALGVVRNDNAPGQVANSYAQSAAHAARPGMTERDWEHFGVDLMRRDLAERQRALRMNEPARALNLSAVDVTRVHDESFEHAGIAKEAWTPRKLMDMAERKGGPAAMEEIWKGMLDNQKLGLYRGVSTLGEVGAHTDFTSLESVARSGRYAADMATARIAANSSLPNTDPNLIGSLNHSYIYSQQSNSWAEVRQRSGSSVPLPPIISNVRDEQRIEQLNDTRALRIERLASRQDRHPEDPYTSIAKSPFTLAEASSTTPHSPEIGLAAAEVTPSWRPLAQNVQTALAERLPQGTAISDDRLAQFTAAAKLARISEHDRLSVDIGTESVTIRGSHPAQLAHVDLTHPLPTAVESHAAFRQAQESQTAALSQQAEQPLEAQRGFERA